MSAQKKVLVPLAPGFEELEAVAIIDVLRRAGIAVTSAGLDAGPIRGSHGITMIPDTCLDAPDLPDDFDAVVLPGGMPGSQLLADDEVLQEILAKSAAAGKTLGAICAAPMALSAAGVTKGRKVTSYPGFEDRLECASYSDSRVVVDGKLVTSRGPGTALEFATTVVAALCGQEVADSLEAGMLISRAGEVEVVEGA